jgi:hypothetical protein
MLYLSIDLKKFRSSNDEKFIYFNFLFWREGGTLLLNLPFCVILSPNLENHEVQGTKTWDFSFYILGR